MTFMTKICDIRPYGAFMQVEIDVDADDLLDGLGDSNRDQGISRMLDEIGLDAVIEHFGIEINAAPINVWNK